MGNFTSCYHVQQLKMPELVDLHGNRRRHIKVPITAAEIMLEEPGLLISPVVDDLRRTFRFSALRADQELEAGKLYMLIPAGRLNTFITDSELEALRSGFNRKVKQVKRRRSSKVLPDAEMGGSSSSIISEESESSSVDSLAQSNSTGRIGGSPLWKPVLEPIHE